MIDFYTLLGVPFNASQQKIKEAYRRKTKTMHPDKGGSEKEFIILQNAFQTLYDEQKRRIYNEQYVAYYEELLKNSKATNEKNTTNRTTSNSEYTNENTTNESSSSFKKTSYEENTDEDFNQTVNQHSTVSKKRTPFRKLIFYFALVILALSVVYFKFIDTILVNAVHEKYSALYDYVDSLQGKQSNFDEDELSAINDANQYIEDTVGLYRAVAGYSILFSFVLLLSNLTYLKGRISNSLSIFISLISLVNLLLASSGINQDYQLTRWISFLCGLYFLSMLLRRKPTSEIFFGFYIIIYGIMIVLFNPFFLIHLNKSFWIFIDLFIFLFIILQSFLINNKLKSANFSNKKEEQKI